MKTVLAALGALVALAGCDRAPANVQTLITTDCGVHWNVIKAGQRIPNSVGPCEYKTVLPDYPMQGDTEFKSQFEGNVLVTVRISYDYVISDPLLYIGEAKFLGKASSSADNAAAGGTSAIEMAENSVIDKRIREVVTSTTPKKNIVDVSTAALEDEIEKAAGKLLSERGVKLGAITFVMIPEEQTRTAIDVATAMNVYKSKGIEDLGTRVAAARAGATRIEVHTPREDKK
jgi:hypothetical protein